MKTGIIIAMAALGMALFAVPDNPAQARRGGHHGPDVNQRFSGSTFVVDTDAAVTGKPNFVVEWALQRAAGNRFSSPH